MNTCWATTTITISQRILRVPTQSGVRASRPSRATLCPLRFTQNLLHARLDHLLLLLDSSLDLFSFIWHNINMWRCRRRRWRHYNTTYSLWHKFVSFHYYWRTLIILSWRRFLAIRHREAMCNCLIAPCLIAANPLINWRVLLIVLRHDQ